MVVRNWVRRNEYRDSVMLMKASEDLRAVTGVVQAALMMGTEANKGVLGSLGLLDDEGRAARADDLLIAVQALDEGAMGTALDQVEAFLGGGRQGTSSDSFRLLESAIQAVPDANLVLISVPGRFAAREARKALQHGLNVFLFSDDVPLEEEVSLKKTASQKGLLLMGPECGTAIINGVGLGFANAVRRGPIGVVAASGSGLQEVSVLVHRQGQGVSQAIGVGGRDLLDAVGGISTLQALDALDADVDTRVIVLLSKPPSATTMAKVLGRAASCSKPVVVCFLGHHVVGPSDRVRVAETLEEAAEMAVSLANGEPYESRLFSISREDIDGLVAQELCGFAPQQRYIRGLFSGGTLCNESMWILQDYVGDVYSNAPLADAFALQDVEASRANTLLDMGEKHFTQGRPHPMIDPTLRKARILDEAKDPEVATILLDVVLGHGSHPDPAGALASSIREAKDQAAEWGGHLSVVASICGTAEDAQNLALQEDVLRKAGVLVMPSNAQASRLAGAIARSSSASEGCPG
jgi:succinyl-CoA synthetase alpha subunit